MHDTYFPKKKASIIIPTLNEEKFVKRLLSRFDKEFKKVNDVELIISDGGSKDSTIKISNEYADKIILNKKNIPQNISQGRNEGAKNSQGDVLIFLNADTYVKDIQYLLEESVKQLADLKTSAIACRIVVFPEEENLSDRMFHTLYNNYVAMLNKFFIGMGRGECHIVKREKFFKIDGYDEKLAAGEDFDLYKRLRKLGKIKFRRDFIIYESPRRYRKYGYAKVFWDWTKNSISVLLFKKSISKEWEAVR
ncbi:MAG: glycosyltransferase [Bacteroidota bacterium]|nr:glycosyltransferase [Bacteroidota bacterium]